MHPLVSLTLQTLLPFVYLASAGAALRVARLSSAPYGWQGTGWRLLALAFGAHGAVLLLHTQFAVAAYAAGIGSSVYATYLTWMPPLNHARSLLLLGFALALMALAVARHPGRRFLVRAGVAMAVGFAAGFAIGVAEAPFRALTHYAAVATWDAVQLVCMLAALLACLVRGRLDRLAWLAVWIYTLQLALNVLLVAGLSRAGVPGEWSPRPWVLHATRLVLALVMAALVYQRLRLARRGVVVNPLARPPRTLDPHPG